MAEITEDRRQQFRHRRAVEDTAMFFDNLESAAYRIILEVERNRLRVVEALEDDRLRSSQTTTAQDLVRWTYNMSRQFDDCGVEAMKAVDSLNKFYREDTL